jgi:hypothetical protein
VFPAGTLELVELVLSAGLTGNGVGCATEPVLNTAGVLNIDAASPLAPTFSADRKTETGTASGNACETRFDVVPAFVFAAPSSDSFATTSETALRMPFRNESWAVPETMRRIGSAFVFSTAL